MNLGTVHPQTHTSHTCLPAHTHTHTHILRPWPNDLSCIVLATIANAREAFDAVFDPKGEIWANLAAGLQRVADKVGLEHFTSRQLVCVLWGFCLGRGKRRVLLCGGGVCVCVRGGGGGGWGEWGGGGGLCSTIKKETKSRSELV